MHLPLLSGSVSSIILLAPSQQQISGLTPEVRVWVCKTKNNGNNNIEVLRPLLLHHDF